MVWVSLLASSLCSAEVNTETNPFVVIQDGELPLLISAPHGGSKDVPGVPARTGETDVDKNPRFVITRDVGTDELAQLVSTGLERHFGRKPFVVRALSHRKYVDLNRSANEAFEHDAARPVYQAYHSNMTRMCREIQKRFHSGLVIDLHGQDVLKDSIARGTQNGKTVALLRERYGEESHVGPNSFFGRLRSAGFKVFPDPLDGREHIRFTGGFTVRTYGGVQAFGLDAIQLEIGSELRVPDRRTETAREITSAIISYCSDYLPSTPKPVEGASKQER